MYNTVLLGRQAFLQAKIGTRIFADLANPRGPPEGERM
ncbi:hypothetical protein PLANPX_1333 [Lacipirellula parvula]|uniref:Uncharacterized protein n=1 Tax=Lacipirellula parvula TaxID=2650471 RepID=A0A5K7XAF4_9BACT|nr:hypothetical protein PLANPX_1333 [Lacipirellula parvula]